VLRDFPVDFDCYRCFELPVYTNAPGDWTGTVYTFGGVYNDAGHVYMNRISDSIDFANNEFVFSDEAYGDCLHNAFFAAYPRHPILWAVQLVVKNINNRYYGEDQVDILLDLEHVPMRSMYFWAATQKQSYNETLSTITSLTFSTTRTPTISMSVLKTLTGRKS